MNNHKVIVVVHINEDLSTEDKHTLETHLSAAEGITSAHINEQRPHLMVVDYDAEAVHSSHLLHHVKQHGYHAQLIGM